MDSKPAESARLEAILCVPKSDQFESSKSDGLTSSLIIALGPSRGEVGTLIGHSSHMTCISAPAPAYLILPASKDSLWSIDLFRCESLTLRAHWVLVVMDQYTRRIIGTIRREFLDHTPFGIHSICNASSTSSETITTITVRTLHFPANHQYIHGVYEC